MTIKKETTLIKVNNKSDSLRTTIPISIKELYELEEGSKITWIYDRKKGLSIEIPTSSRNERGGV
jgi:bifunctional DNA-binding transcriptional regulator/antitoxin component of YhaV-PrlF toxin-antitoxin module